MKSKFSAGKWLLALHSFALIFLIINQFAPIKTSSTTQYIRVGEVYQEFALTKELNKELKTVENLRKSILDSMELNLQLRAKKLSNMPEPEETAVAAFRQMQNEFLQKKKEFETTNQTLMEQYNQQVTTQLNQFVKDFGEKEGYEYIYGADGSGSLMYADNSRDVTTEVIDYINKRYSDQ